MHSRLSFVASAFLAAASALFVACCTCPDPVTLEVAAPVPDPIARFEGRWARYGPYNIIGAGSDHVWTIAREEGCWTLAITVVRHPSVNEESRALTRVTYAPTPLTWRDGRLEFVDPQNPEFRVRFTADIVGNELMLPAVVRRDARTWEYQDRHDNERFQCAHDPHVVSSGDASLTRAGIPRRPVYYRMIEEKSVVEQDTTKPAVLFFQVDTDGVERTCARLVFQGEPWGTVARLGTSFSGFHGERWERLGDEDWYRIKFLPPAQPQWIVPASKKHGG